MVSTGGKVVWSKYAQVTNNPGECISDPCAHRVPPLSVRRSRWLRERSSSGLIGARYMGDWHCSTTDAWHDITLQI